MKRQFAVSAYIEHDAKLLLVNHVKQQSWVPVGGKLLTDETPMDAVIREISEETGMELEFDYDFYDVTSFEMNICKTPGLIAYEEHEVLPDGIHMCFSFLITAKHRFIKPCPEYTDMKWISVGEWQTLQIPPNVRMLVGRCFNIIHGR